MVACGRRGRSYVRFMKPAGVVLTLVSVTTAMVFFRSWAITSAIDDSGPRRATPLLLFQHRAGQFQILTRKSSDETPISAAGPVMHFTAITKFRIQRNRKNAVPTTPISSRASWLPAAALQAGIRGQTSYMIGFRDWIREPPFRRWCCQGR